MAAAPGKKGGNNECVQVVVRCRPFNTKEKNENRGNIVEIDTNIGQVALKGTGQDQEPKAFTFDAAYDETITQRLFYEESCYPLVESVIEGFNGTIFAYGQTGCGKTHTMQGLNDPPELRGVIPNSFDHIFETIRATNDAEFLVRCSFLEIYNEEIRDLLGNDPKLKCELKEDPSRGVFVKDLTDVVVQDEATLNRVMDKGIQNRTTGATLMNQGSSRSHGIFTITIETSHTSAGQTHFKVGKLNLVDLAGSERQSKTGATGDRLKEGSKINLSLSALGNVISALADGKGKHIPYRDSKLTRLLQDSLGGNTKTLMVAAISPADYNYDETLSTLRYANRAKNIKNKPKVNEDPKDALLRQMKDEIEALRQMLELAKQGGLDPSALLQKAAGASAPAPAPSASGASAPAPASGGGAVEERVVEREVVREVPVEVVREVVKTVVQEKVVEVHVPVEKEKIVQVEVAPKSLLNAKEALENLNLALISNRDQLGEQLQVEKAIREQLESKLANLERNILGETVPVGASLEGAAEGVEDPLVVLAKKKAEQRRLQQKLKAKKKKEAALEADKRKAQEDKAEIEEELKSAVEQSEMSNKKLQRYKARVERKIREAREEMEDLSQEFDRERDTMLETIREQNREIKLWEQVVGLLMSQKTVNKIWEKALWDEEAEEWHLPRIRNRASGGTGRNAAVKLPGIAAPSPSGNGGRGLMPASGSEVDEGETTGGSTRAARRQRRESNASERPITREGGAGPLPPADGDYDSVGMGFPDGPQPPRSRSGRRRSNSSNGRRASNARRSSGGNGAPGDAPSPLDDPQEGPGGLVVQTGMEDDGFGGLSSSGGAGRDAGAIKDWDFVGDPAAMPSRDSRYSEDRLSSRQGGDRRSNMPPPAVRAPNGGRELQPLDYSPSPNASSSGPGPASGKPPKNSPASLGAEPDPLGEDLSARKQGGVRLKRIGSTNAAKLAAGGQTPMAPGRSPLAGPTPRSAALMRMPLEDNLSSQSNNNSGYNLLASAGIDDLLEGVLPAKKGLQSLAPVLRGGGVNVVNAASVLAPSQGVGGEEDDEEGAVFVLEEEDDNAMPPTALEDEQVRITAAPLVGGTTPNGGRRPLAAIQR